MVPGRGFVAGRVSGVGESVALATLLRETVSGSRVE